MTKLDTHSKFKITNVSRRGLLKGVAATGGLVLAAQWPTVKGALAAYPTGGDTMPNGLVSNPKVFVSIGGDGTVSIVAARAEMGNGAARTALPMMLADELEADWARVRVVQSPGDERTYGNQDTDGSRSVRHWIQPMRLCGASHAHHAGAGRRAEVEGCPWSEVQAQLHEVVHKPSGRKLSYGDLAGDAAGLPVPAADKVKLKEASAFRYIGKGTVRIADLHDITTGKATYGQDVMLPGMKFAVIARPPVVGGKVATLELKRGPQGAGRGEDHHAAADAGALQVRPARRRGRHRQEHLGGDEGSRGAQDHLGRRAQQGLRLQGLPGAAGSDREEAGQGRAQRRRCRQGAGLGRARDHGRVLCPAHPPRHHGAAGGHRADEPGPMGSVGAGAKPRRRPRRRRRGARRHDGGADALSHAAGRRLRPQVQVRLRHRGRAAVQGPGRHAGQGGVDARGRRPPRLLPHRDGRAPRGRHRRQQEGGGLAASQRVAVDPLHVRARSEASLRHRARHGLGRYAVRRAQHPHGERRGAEPRAHRLVPVGQQRGQRLVDPVVRRRDRASAGQGPQGLPARADRTGPHRRSETAGDDRLVELRRAFRDLPDPDRRGCAR